MSRTILLTLTLWLLAANVRGAAPTSWGACGSDTTVITSLPYDATLDNHCYRLSGDLSSTTDGIRILNCMNTSFFFDTDTIKYGTGGGNSLYGLKLQGDGTDSVNIYGGIFWHAPSDPITADSCYTLLLDAGHNIYFEDCEFYVEGSKDTINAYKSHAVYRWGNGTVHNIEWNGGKWHNNVVGFRHRGAGDGLVAAMTHGQHWYEDSILNTTYSAGYYGYIPGSSSNYHWKIHGVRIEGSGGISIRGKFFIYNDTFFIDQRNYRYQNSYPTDNWSKDWANQGGIMMQDVQPGSYIKHCDIRPDTVHYGIDAGLLLQSSWGQDWNYPIEICSNYVAAHCGFSPHYGWGLYAKPFKSRYGGGNYVKVYDNVFVVHVSDSSSLGTSYGKNGAAIYTLSATGNPGVGWHDNTPDSHYIVENNLCSVYIRHADAGFAMAYLFSSGDETAIGTYDMEGADVHYRYNKFYIPLGERTFSIGGSDGDAQGVLTYGDSIFFTDSVSGRADDYMFINPNAGTEAPNNRIRDIYFSDGLDHDTNIYLANGSPEKQFFLERTFETYVRGNNDLPVVNALCSIWNVYSDFVGSGTTDTNGLFLDTIRYLGEWESPDADSTYSDFVLRATLGSNVDSNTAKTIGWTTLGGTDTLDFDTVGTGYWLNPTGVLEMGRKLGKILLRKIAL